MMREYSFEELGYLPEAVCEKVREVVERTTYMRFMVRWSNVCGNCTLIACTDYEASESEIRGLFLNTVITTLALSLVLKA